DKGRKAPRGNYIGYTPLNTSRETILQECTNAEFAEAGICPPREIKENPRTYTTKFCRFHRSARHDTEDCTQLKDAIEDLIRIGKLSRVEAIKGKETEDSEGDRDPGKRPFVATITGGPTIPAISPVVKKNDNRDDQAKSQNTASKTGGPSNQKGDPEAQRRE
ncbi:hypothetical protein A2U01_0038633, partial [Trifolium medium]|nr:hypothetical protein [Trifolium medium]